ncbi:MAG: RHS repeat-associated core domain-containing protein [Acidithiobacillus ferrivorans]
MTHAHGGTYNYGAAPTLPTPLTTEKFYDGADRLVEVVQPHDAAHDVYSSPWTTRYLYDLSQNGREGTPTFDGQAISAHGNLYKTQELLPAGGQVVSWTDSYGTLPAMANTQFQELKGTAFDALGRPTAAYSYVNRGGSSDALNVQTSSYDTSPATYGLLAQHCNDLGQCATLAYDALGRTTSVTFNDPVTPNRTTTYDPDGRVASVTSSLFGTAGYVYDADGHRITSTEATGGGVTSPATISHSYYPNGALEAVSVASSGLNQNNLFTYSYDTPGQMQTLAIDDGNVANVVAAGTTALHFTYSNAGRLVERTETGAGANLTPETMQYDSTYGFLTGEQVPGGSLSAFEYSGEGELLGRFAQVAGASSSHLTTLTYTARGELVKTSVQNGMPTPAYADGVLVQVPGGGTTNWDSAMGVPLGTGTQLSNTGVSFDAAGRLVSESSYSGDTTSGGATSSTNTQTTRTYDAENHLLSTQYVSQGNTYDAALIEYGWGPSGHPLRIGSAQNIQRTAGNWTPPTAAQVQYDTLHWDGSQLLFETNPAGQVDAVNVGTLGAILPLDSGYNGLTFWDRQSDGSVAFCHNAMGAGGGGAVLPYTLTLHSYRLGDPTINVNPCGGIPKSVVWWASPGFRGMVSANVGIGGVVGMSRTDGIDDGLDVIQGVRSYDTQAGIWASPDAYAGTVNDPATQKSYMWNNNNPISYSDPSGYDAIYVGYWVAVATPMLILPGTFAVIKPVPFYHTFVVVKNDHGKTIAVYSFGSKFDSHHIPYLNTNYGMRAARTEARNTKNLHLVYKCVGKCKGEGRMATFYRNWKNNSTVYEGFRHNSNWAASLLFGAGGYGSASPPGAPGVVPGWRDAAGGKNWLLNAANSGDFTYITESIGWM